MSDKMDSVDSYGAESHKLFSSFFLDFSLIFRYHFLKRTVTGKLCPAVLFLFGKIPPFAFWACLEIIRALSLASIGCVTTPSGHFWFSVRTEITKMNRGPYPILKVKNGENT